VGKQIERQQYRFVKRVVLAPVAGPVRRWALSGPPTRAKLFALRYVVLTGLTATGKQFERSVGSGLTFGANSEDLLPVMVLIFGVWEPVLTEFLRRRLEPGRVFVDVGANLGWFTTNAAHWVGPTGSVVAMEPAPVLYEQLVTQLRRNDIANVRAVNEAAGAATGRVRIEPGPSAHTGLTRVVDSLSGSPDEISTRPLSLLLDQNEIARCRAIKIDVEGYEYNVARGMQDLLSRLPSDAEVIVEVGPARAKSSNDVVELFEIFRSRGFHPYVMPNDYSMAAYRDPVFPDALERLHDLPTRETDVVFSRRDELQLEF
jgi:FkbM family methyltransferase